jgi:putative addiction module component (TIGR02574 family)
MAVQPEQLFHDAMELEHSDRVKLLEALIDSLDPATESGVEEAWRREIDRRSDEVVAGTAATEPWEELRQRLRHSTR